MKTVFPAFERQKMAVQMWMMVKHSKLRIPSACHSREKVEAPVCGSSDSALLRAAISWQGCRWLIVKNNILELQVVLTFFIGDGLLLENMSASFIYANITNKNYRQQQYRFDAIFINRLANQDNVEPKSTGYEAGDLIRTSLSTGTFSLPFGSECNDTQQMEVKFGFHISTACRIRFAVKLKRPLTNNQ